MVTEQNYVYKIKAIDIHENESDFSREVNVFITSIEYKQDEIPRHFRLDQNYPNPFNPLTTIEYQLPMMSNVVLSIHTLNGQKVATLVTGKQSAGKYKAQWDASGFASGVYYYRLQASAPVGEKKNSFMQTKKLIVLK